MPLPEQIANRTAHGPIGTPGWSGQLLMFSGTVFFISLAVYLGIAYGYKPYLERQVAILDEQIKSYTRQITPDEQEKLISFYSQVANLNEILKSRFTPSQIFGWLEKNTGANIYYNGFGFLLADYQVNLSGISKTVDGFSKQMVLFQNNPAVERASINSFSSAGGNLWQFNVSLFLNKDALNSGVTVQQEQ